MPSSPLRSICCYLTIVITLAPALYARTTSLQRAHSLREVLESEPQAQRTHREYDRVLNAYRAIYHSEPTSPSADAAIVAVAELLAEEGRTLGDTKALNDALGQYEFLRREYPSSTYCADALLAEAEIYRRDLNDRPQAKSAFRQFLSDYPKNRLKVQAHAELKEIGREEAAEKHGAAKANGAGLGASSGTMAASVPDTPTRKAVKESSPPDAATLARSPASMPPPPSTSPSTSSSTSPTSTTTNSPHAPAAGASALPEQPTPAKREVSLSTPPRRGKLPLVTGIRHWSTPVYTRVAIDLEDEVQYEAARVPGPDRIFFDLHGARLSPQLIGKSFQITDDGFLKRVRAAQFSNDVTRVVLDVSDVSDYSAFLLPNPYRLIIDIHGRKPGSPQQIASQPAPANSTLPGSQPLSQLPQSSQSSQSQQLSQSHAQIEATASPSSASKGTEAQAKAPAITGSTSPPASSPAAKKDKAASLQEVASLDREPNRIKATRGPTTEPIAASVSGTSPAPQPDSADSKLLSGLPLSTKKKKGSPTSSSAQEMPSAETHEATPTATGERSLVRALGLKIGRIVVDAGHGGHDSGTLGPEGIEEKEVVLDVALRLGKLLKQRLGADVIFTRDDDTFIPLETRTAIANKAQADLFISVHANSSHDPSARGVETYYLNFTSSPDALEVAARENSVSNQSIHQLSDLVKKITLKDKIDESREFASDVQQGLYQGIAQGNAGLKDRGVKKAPFVVLIGANMPSILAEISFLTNPDDARQLRDPGYRQRIAESLYRGVAKYIGGLSGVRLAQNNLKP